MKSILVIRRQIRDTIQTVVDTIMFILFSIAVMAFMFGFFGG